MDKVRIQMSEDMYLPRAWLGSRVDREVLDMMIQVSLLIGLPWGKIRLVVENSACDVDTGWSILWLTGPVRRCDVGSLMDFAAPLGEISLDFGGHMNGLTGCVG